MATSYPLMTFHFEVDWGGTTAGFSEVSGLSFTTEVASYAHGAMREYSDIKIPGRQTWSEITLSKGVFAGDNEIYDWWKTVEMGTIERRDITISLLDSAHNPVMVWRVKNAFPSKVEGVTLKADSNDVAVEKMTLVHEGFTQENLG